MISIWVKKKYAFIYKYIGFSLNLLGHDNIESISHKKALIIVSILWNVHSWIKFN